MNNVHSRDGFYCELLLCLLISYSKFTRTNKETALLLENCPAKIEAGGMLDIIMATKREQVRKLHPYAITPPKTESGRWQTTYRDSNNKRISIKAQTEN